MVGGATAPTARQGSRCASQSAHEHALRHGAGFLKKMLPGGSCATGGSPDVTSSAIWAIFPPRSTRAHGHSSGRAYGCQ